MELKRHIFLFAIITFASPITLCKQISNANANLMANDETTFYSGSLNCILQVHKTQHRTITDHSSNAYVTIKLISTQTLSVHIVS